jgi:hypothetical protein
MGIELSDIDRTRLRSFSLAIGGFHRFAVDAHAGLWRSWLESADSEGRERKLSFDDLGVAIEIEPSV